MSQGESIVKASEINTRGYGHRELWNAEAERYSRAPTARFEDDGFFENSCRFRRSFARSPVVGFGLRPRHLFRCDGRPRARRRRFRCFRGDDRACPATSSCRKLPELQVFRR